MWSPGRYYEGVPKGQAENVAYRKRVLAACRADAGARQAALEMCRRDILWFVNVWVWQFNPRKKGTEAGPFVTWGFQDEAFRVMLSSIERDEDLLIEKSREMGASWMILIVFLWLLLFHGWKKFLMISRNEKAVEDDDPDSLFWKVDFMLRYLPDWMSGGVRRRKLFFGNDWNDSTLTGEASTGQAGVGGRATAMGIDEFSQIREDYEVLHRTSDTTGCRIFNGTHKGTNTAFHELSRRVDMKKLVMHWSQHPGKNPGLYRWNHERKKIEVLDTGYPFPPDYQFVTDGTPTGGPFPGLRSPWYDEQCRRKGSKRAIAMDLDIDPSGSVSQFFDPLLINQLKAGCTEPVWEGDLEHTEDGRPVRLVQRAGGRLRLWVKPTHDGLVAAGKYTIGADCAAGTGRTPSSVTVVNAATGEKLVEYIDPFIEPRPLGVFLVALAWLFKQDDGEGAYLGWEIPGPGITVGKQVVELGYRRFYRRSNEYALNPNISDQPGWVNTPTNLLAMLHDYRSALTTRKFLNRSRRSLEETLAFRYNAQGQAEHSEVAGGDDPSGARVNHADTVISDALAWKLAKEAWKGRAERKGAKVPVLSLAWRRQLRQRGEAESLEG